MHRDTTCMRASRVSNRSVALRSLAKSFSANAWGSWRRSRAANECCVEPWEDGGAQQGQGGAGVFCGVLTAELGWAVGGKWGWVIDCSGGCA